MGLLKGLGGLILFAAVLLGLVWVSLLFIHGGAWVANVSLPWLIGAGWITLALNLLIFLPLSFVRGTRRFCAHAIYISSHLFGIVLWLWSLLLTYVLWGPIALLIGLMLFGVGVLPIALVAAVVNGLWGTVLQLIVLFVLTMVSRFYGVHLLEETSAVGVLST
jgi:hypothetical protein